jgi:hypothetical protein
MSTELTIILAIAGFLVTVITTALAVSKFFASRMSEVKDIGRKEGKLDLLIENLIKEVRAMAGKLEGIENSSKQQTFVCTAHRDETVKLKVSLDKAWEKIDGLIDYNRYISDEMKELKGGKS